MSNAGRDALVAMLSRLRNDLAAINLSKPDAARAALQVKYPLNGDYMLEVRRLCQRGVDEGWLCDTGSAGARFSRLSKASKTFPFSVDAVELAGDGMGHGHPKGEVNICWALDGSPRFCGSAPGWVVFAPGSKHVPTVTGGRMFLLYFLPDGQIDWDVKVKSASGAGRGTAVLSDASGAQASASRAASARSAAARDAASQRSVRRVNARG